MRIHSFYIAMIMQDWFLFSMASLLEQTFILGDLFVWHLMCVISSVLLMVISLNLHMIIVILDLGRVAITVVATWLMNFVCKKIGQSLLFMGQSSCYHLSVMGYFVQLGHSPVS